MSLKQLIVSADDYGLSEGVNRGIMHCFKEGVVSSASLMPTGMAFDHAIDLAKRNPDFFSHLRLYTEGAIFCFLYEREDSRAFADHYSNTACMRCSDNYAWNYPGY